MNSKFRRLSPKARARIVAGLKRSWQTGGTHREMQRARGLQSSAETERRRAAWDAKGQVEVIVTLPDRSTLVVRCSFRGRSDQFDVCNGARIISTASAPRTMRFLIQLASLCRHPGIF